MNRGELRRGAGTKPAGVATLESSLAMVASNDSALSEIAMHGHQDRPHYAPASVGALMDPAFLRSAAIDASGDRRAENSSPVTLRQRWLFAVHAVAAALRRH